MGLAGPYVDGMDRNSKHTDASRPEAERERVFAHLWDGNNADVYADRDALAAALLEQYADDDPAGWEQRIAGWIDETEANPGEAVAIDGGMSWIRYLSIVGR